MLQDLAGRSWKVVVEKNDNDFFFMGGWPDFVRDNNLKFGEFLTFSYVGNSNFYVKIYGINGSLKRDVTAIKEPELHPLDEEIVQEIGTAAPPADQALNGSGDLVVYAPSFDIVIKPSYIRKKRLNVQAAFGNRYLNRGQGQNFEAALQTDRGSWPVSVHNSDRLILQTGFGEFIASNALREGDVCQFMLIDEEKFMLEVSIRRQLK
ncbi:B3 domain-containing protein REM19 isoform X2 [Nicotiana tabacum]|nr:PREDICTED: B3 domain-containing protein REM19-like isoform X2 [Nicotiana tabacum]